MKNKKFVSIILASLLLLSIISLSGCGGDSEDSSSSGSNSSSGEADKTVEKAFEPQGETVTSTADTMSVLAPSTDYDMWKDIDWTIKPEENGVELGLFVSGETKFRVRPGVANMKGQPFGTAEEMEEALESGEYAEWLGDSEIVKEEVGDYILYEKVKTENDPPPHDYTLIKDGEIFFISAYCKEEEYQEVYDNLLLQVVMTVENKME